MKHLNRTIASTLAPLVILTAALAPCFADASFYSTDAGNVSHWLVSSTTSYAPGEGPVISESDFVTDSFQTAAALQSRTGWIANNSTGNNGPSVGYWTLFVFRQTFDLSGYDPATASLSFSWAADDSGAADATQGRWIPKFRLNGGDWHVYPTWNGSSYTDSARSYSLQGDSVTTGFISGLNTIDFYVEGNGITDGLSLENVVLTVTVVPEPSACALVLGGLVLLRSRLSRAAKPA